MYEKIQNNDPPLTTYTYLKYAELIAATGALRPQQDGPGVLRLHHALHGRPRPAQEPDGGRLRQHHPRE